MMLRTRIISFISLIGSLVCSGSQNCFAVSDSEPAYSFYEISQKAVYEKTDFDIDGIDDNSIYTNGLISASILSTQPETTYVYTPNGTAVEVFIREELSEAEIEEHDHCWDDYFPDASLISSSSRLYNCHSYAWYMQSTSNPYWMNSPTSYYTDGSYVESTGKVGDIVCYYNAYGENLHSGVIVGTLEGESNGKCGDVDLFTVRSKWGEYGLYEHRGDDCPYTTSIGGNAKYVKYYTPAVHTHSYNYSYEWFTYTKHLAICNCGSFVREGHAVSSGAYSSGNLYATCLLCGGSAKMGFTQLGVNSTEITQVTDNGSFILPNGVIVLVDEDIDAYLNGTLEFHAKNDAAVA